MTEEEFTGFARKHYRVTSGPCWDACNAFRARREEVSKEHCDFAEKVGGIGTYAGSTENVGNATAINAVIFEGDLASGWKPRNWRNFNGLKRGQMAAWPDKRTNAGKALLAEIAALPLLPTDDRVAKAIGFPMSLEYERDDCTGCESLSPWSCAKVGWIKDTFYVSLPDFAGQKARRVAEGYTVSAPDWMRPEGMEPLLKEEVDLDYAREKLRRQEEAAKATGKDSSNG